MSCRISCKTGRQASPPFHEPMVVFCVLHLVQRLWGSLKYSKIRILCNPFVCTLQLVPHLTHPDHALTLLMMSFFAYDYVIWIALDYVTYGSFHPWTFSYLCRVFYPYPSFSGYVMAISTGDVSLSSSSFYVCRHFKILRKIHHC